MLFTPLTLVVVVVLSFPSLANPAFNMDIARFLGLVTSGLGLLCAVIGAILETVPRLVVAASASSQRRAELEDGGRDNQSLGAFDDFGWCSGRVVKTLKIEMEAKE